MICYLKKSTVINTIVTWYPCQRGTNSIASTDPMGIFNYFFRGNSTWKNGKQWCCILKRLCHLIISEYWPPISESLGMWFCQTLRAWFKCNDCLEDSQTTQRWALQWTDFTHRSTNAVLMVLQPCEKHNLLNKRIWQAQKKLLKLQVLLYYRIFCSKEVFFVHLVITDCTQESPSKYMPVLD